MANPKSPEARQAYIDQRPFEGLQISDNSVLNELAGRHPCPNCGKSRKFFCYNCYVPIAELKGSIPQVKLPIKIDIIKHKHEIDGKSTAIHAVVLAPEDVQIYTYPDIPNYDNENAVLIFPSYHAVTVDQLFSENYKELCSRKKNESSLTNNGINPSTLLKHLVKDETEGKHQSKNSPRPLPITKAVFIDSTWNQSKGIYKDNNIRKLPCVVLQNRVSQFWRHQKGSPRWYLATVEAIHQFLVELHINMWGISDSYQGLKNCFTEKYLNHIMKFQVQNSDVAYAGQYDDLLFFFHHLYDLIHSYYDHDSLLAYKRSFL